MTLTRRPLVGIGALSLALVLGACSGSATADPAASGTATQAAGTTQTPAPSTITELFDRWNATLATGDPQKVADLYAPNAVLLPTVSNEVRTDRAGIVDYFTEFLKKKPSGTITSSTVTVLNPQDAIHTGTYEFALTEGGETRRVPARYTFVYEQIGEKWLIVNHHSSVMPED